MERYAYFGVRTGPVRTLLFFSLTHHASETPPYPVLVNRYKILYTMSTLLLNMDPLFFTAVFISIATASCCRHGRSFGTSRRQICRDLYIFSNIFLEIKTKLILKQKPDMYACPK